MPGLFQRAVVAFDVEGFSDRNVRERERVQSDLLRILTDAANAAGLNRDEWWIQSTGDGELAALPASVNLLSLVRRFTAELDTLLTDHNEEHSEQTRIRLRVAMHIGTMTTAGPLGSGSQALIDVSRLLDCQPVRTALKRARAASLALIVSQTVFDQVIATQLDGLRPDQFSKVLVNLPAKKFRQNAYLYIPGYRPASQRPAPTEPIWPDWVIPRPQPGPQGPATDPEDAPPPPPAVHPAGIKSLLADLRDAAGRRDYTRADALTTRILLTGVGRVAEGWLRARDADHIDGQLFTDIDAIWASCSEGRWGFAAQRSTPGAGRPARYQVLSREFGWRPGQELPPAHAEFTASPPHDLPFFPTLRTPGLEETVKEAVWRELWQRTVESVHDRLWDWKPGGIT